MAEQEQVVAPESPSVKDSLRRVLRNPNLRRIQLAFAGSLLGGWTAATAITVWAYQEGGATAVGTFQAARFVGMAIATPIGATIADRMSRRLFMLVTDLLCAAMVALMAGVIALDGPSALVYVLGVAVSMVSGPFRSAQAGLIPSLVDRPDELTASNAIAANLENIMVLAGPTLGASLLFVVDIEIVVLLNAATFVWSFLLVAAIRVPRRDDPPDAAAQGDAQDPQGFAREVAEGFTTVARDRSLRTMSLLAASQGFVWGALTVFTVIVAITMLDTGPQGVGYLDAVMGVGTLLGGVVVLGRLSRGRLGRDMVIGVLGWALPLLALAAFPSVVTAFAALIVIGLLDPWVNLGFETIPQRLAPERVISRVYAAADCALVGAMALGAALAPLLVSGLGFRTAMAVVGGAVAVYAVSTWPTMRALDARLTAPEHLSLVRRTVLFAPLAPPAQEAVARQLTTLSVPAGEPVVREGETSDRFFLIRSGVVEVTQEGRRLRTEAAGEFFGEIGLLRDVPRTATVTAADEVELLVLTRADFLAAVTGVQESRIAAEEVVSRRLAV